MKEQLPQDLLKETTIDRVIFDVHNYIEAQVAAQVKTEMIKLLRKKRTEAMTSNANGFDIAKVDILSEIINELTDDKKTY